MRHDEIRWATIDREDLLDVLLGEHKPLDLERRMQPDLELRGTKLAVGYRDTQSRGGYQVPSLFIIADDAAIETFSWLRTFADEASPLSQYGRVAVASDWRRFEVRRETIGFSDQRPDLWSSIAVGEALSQMEGEISLPNLPLSRFAGCFTTPIARAALIWGQDEATYACANRLRQLEGDRRFARRPVGVEQLLPVWAIARARIEGHLPPSEAASYVLGAAGAHYRAKDSKNASSLSPLTLKEVLGLSSDSIEERVSAFNRLASDIQQRAQPNRSAASLALDSVLLASAAFQVGRSTSHVFLLQRAQGFAPAAAAWFGAIAALAGPRAWDKAWLKAAKGAERLLRPEFNWLESSGADICWSEFAWLAKIFDGLDVFLELPKMLPRTLGIEIIPGAVGQFRLAGESGEIESKSLLPPEISARERALMETVSQFIALAMRAKGEVDQSILSSCVPPVQASFGFGKNASAEKRPRTKRGKRDANNS
ncbi:MAG: hypothetical protein IV112_14220 [Methyloversatilis discipulorum]|uniref:hypothetical protein n=1 Tax=Methyloversatilis discipulorum TaxID=1119528 RepID=UPI0026EF1137|nr:hypothetical protein [Methyloversatilis discipulorum]MBT9517840.1 hypothetical protein [Methyloversatilis discipulorum]